MSQAMNMYAPSIEQAANMILVGGHKKTVLLQGHMGTGKSAILNILSEKLPKHVASYFDCTTKDLGDIMIPNILAIDREGKESLPYVSFATNEELALHYINQPVIIMVDEFGKANPSVKNGLTRLMLERVMGSRKLHPESLVFATTNLGGEGVGDLLMPHHRNRITVVNMRKPQVDEWVEWGINHNIEPVILKWVKDNPQLFQSFEDVGKPEDNPYIFHPMEQRAAFVTPRSLEGASDWLKFRDKIDNNTMTASLIGTIGERGAMDLMAYVSMADQLPTLESIKKNPKDAKIPQSAAAVCMVVYRTLATIEREWVNAWMDYLIRLDKEAQGMFANGVRSEKYAKQSLVLTNKKFTAWALENNYMFAADKK